jgi:predicted ATPase
LSLPLPLIGGYPKEADGFEVASLTGVYLLDEPEAAFSPLKQLSLISFIPEVIKKSNAQFIIATHSP